MREGQLTSNILSEEEWSNAIKTGGNGQIPSRLLPLGPVVVCWEMGEMWLTDCASEAAQTAAVSSLGLAARAREQLPPWLPLTKEQPAWENHSFPQGMTVPTEMVASVDLNPTMAGFQAPLWENGLSLATMPVPHWPPDLSSLLPPHFPPRLYADSMPGSVDSQRVGFPRKRSKLLSHSPSVSILASEQ